MKQGITITREYDHHDRSVVRITKRRGKLTLEEVSDLLRTEGWGEWNGYYAIVLNCSEGTLGGNGLYGYEEPKGDALDLYQMCIRDRHKCADKVACQCTAEVVLRLALRRNGLHLQPQSAQQRYKDLDRLRVTLDAKKSTCQLPPAVILAADRK